MADLQKYFSFKADLFSMISVERQAYSLGNQRQNFRDYSWIGYKETQCRRTPHRLSPWKP